MKIPVAIVAAVLVWSSARYLPPYFLELRRMDLVEHKIQMDAARQVAMLKELRAQSQMQARPSSETAVDKRFY